MASLAYVVFMAALTGSGRLSTNRISIVIPNVLEPYCNLGNHLITLSIHPDAVSGFGTHG